MVVVYRLRRSVRHSHRLVIGKLIPDSLRSTASTRIWIDKTTHKVCVYCRDRGVYAICSDLDPIASPTVQIYLSDSIELIVRNRMGMTTATTTAPFGSPLAAIAFLDQLACQFLSVPLCIHSERHLRHQSDIKTAIATLTTTPTATSCLFEKTTCRSLVNKAYRLYLSLHQRDRQIDQSFFFINF